MFTTSLAANRMGSGLRRSLPLCTGLIAFLLFCSPASGQEKVDGLFVSIPNPIAGGVKNQIKDITQRAVDKHRQVDPNRAFKIVYDFNPHNGASNSTDFDECNGLAKYISGLQGVTTIAFVHGKVTGHAVLPVLACRYIVMSSDSKLGDAMRDQKLALRQSELEGYKEIIRDRDGRFPAIVFKMLDPEMVVLKATKVKDGSTWYIDAAKVEDERKNGIVPVVGVDPAVGKGPESTLFSAQQALDLGLCDLKLEDRQSVAQAYQLPPSSLREDTLRGKKPIARKVEIHGPMTTGMSETIQRRIRRAIGQKANVIVLQIECSGGDIQAARDLAEFLRTLTTEDGEGPSVLTIAYLPGDAADTAVFVALGCTEIVMDKNAHIGDFSNIVTEKKTVVEKKPGGREEEQVLVVDVPPDRYEGTHKQLEELAKKQGYPTLLIDGMFDRQLTLYQAIARKGAGEWSIIKGQEYEEDQKSKDPKWNGRLIKAGGPQGKLLNLSAQEAIELHLALHEVDGLGGLCEVYGINPSQLRTAGPDWLEDVAYFLQLPGTGFFLVMLGITCLLLELKLPGIGLPGIIAAICFILFFWAHSLNGQFTLLAVMLFVLGLILIGLEIFVMPGIGVAGISGTILVVLSLALVTLEKKPETREEWVSFGGTMATFAVSMGGAVVAALTAAWYLPSIPYVNRLVLRSPADEAEAGGEGEKTAADLVPANLAALLGAIGVAVTPLRPAGKVKFGDEYVDVVAESSYVQPGNRVQVIEIEGNRIVVKEV